jgi:enamine deaminase RidA (YjgF/YER057c/UK114 family)
MIEIRKEKEKKRNKIMPISDKLKELGIELPKAADPVGAYVAYKIVDNLLYISGQLPIDINGKMIKGKLGKDLTLEQGQEASKLCVVNILAQAKKAMGGDLDKIKNCIKITGFVNSKDDFIDQPKVINPASETLASVFGDKGKHARAAVSCNSLPLGIAVEIDAIFEI